jgi:hypothetical protein
MASLIRLVSLSMGLYLCCLESLAMLLGLPLLEDEQKFKPGGCVGAYKTLISCVNMSSKYIK